MPSKGSSEHEYLKKCAMKKCISIYGNSLEFLRHEQPQDQNGTDDKNYFRVNISLGSGWIDDLAVDCLNFPDIVACVKTGINGDVGKKFVIVECETKKSSWIVDEKNPRHNSYHLIKSRHDNVVLILATFKDVKLSRNDLFNRIWRFSRR